MKMTLTEEEFKKIYKERFNAIDREVRNAELIHAYIIKRPNYSQSDDRLEPEGKKVFIYSTPGSRGKGESLVKRIFQIENAEFTESLDKADIAVYLGKYICDYGEHESSAIMPILNKVQSEDISAVVFTDGNLYFRCCQGRCPEDKFMLDLIRKGKKINNIPIGWPYNNLSLS